MERDAGVEGGGDECMTQRVGSDTFRDTGLAGDAVHDATRGVTVEAMPVAVEEDGAFAAVAYREVDGACGAGREGDGDDLAALADDAQRPVTAFEAELFDVGTERL